MNNKIKAILMMLPLSIIMLYVFITEPLMLQFMLLMIGGIAVFGSFFVGFNMLTNPEQKKDEVK